jgi:hypothetical protein
MLNDIRKRLYQRSQPARTARHSRWEKEMQLRRKQKEKQETEVQITIYETEQQQEQKKKDDKKRKDIAKPNHTTEWIHRMADADYATRRNGRRTRTAIEDDITGTTKNTPQRRHAQSQDKDSLQLPRPAFARHTKGAPSSRT